MFFLLGRDMIRTGLGKTDFQGGLQSDSNPTRTCLAWKTLPVVDYRRHSSQGCQSTQAPPARQAKETNGAPLTFLEIFSRTKHQNKTSWITPSPQNTTGINVLVLEALWLTVLQEGSNSSSLLLKWPYQINEIFPRTQEL
ncbi:hypothetical protein TNCV_1652571 [Trichonephila clavipes]|nr:hypothetical protein TNCV_1652571 [Trichonephila clavipes]